MNFCSCGHPWCPDLKKLRAYHAAKDREYTRRIREHERRVAQERESERQLAQEERLLLASATTGDLRKLDKLLRPRSDG